MFITSVLLMLASILPMDSREEIDDAKLKAYEFRRQNNYDSAHLVMDQAIASAKRISYKYGEAKSIFIKSYLFRRKNELGKSFELNLKALKILESSEDERTPITLAQIYGNTGEILINHFKYQEAIQYFDKGLQVAMKHNLDQRIQNLLYNRGYAFRKAANYESAKADFERSLQYSEKIEDEWMFLNSRNMLGKVAMDYEHFEEARNHFQAIITHSFKEESSDEYKGMAFANIGKSYYLEGKISQSRAAYLKSIDHNSLIEDSTQLFESQLALVELNLGINDLKEARYYGNLAKESYDHTILSPDNYELFNLLTTIAFKQNEYADAQKFYHQYVTENEAFLQTQKETLQLSEQYKMEMLTASFFKEIEKQEQMAQLNQIIYLLLGLGLLSFIFVRAKKYLLKRSLEQAFREVAQKKNLHF